MSWPSKTIMWAVFLLICSYAHPSWSLPMGTDITIFDGVTLSKDSGSTREDHEADSLNSYMQQWDLEGFFLQGTQLTMVGGYDFKDGYGNIRPGDLFIDIDGDAQYGLANAGTPHGTATHNTFGYDYALVFDIEHSKFRVYDLEGASLLTVKFKNNAMSGAWKYLEGGALYYEGDLEYWKNLKNSQVNAMVGGYHFGLSMDLGFLPFGTQFMAHYTMECGNDNLMGEGRLPSAAVPEPATIIYLLSGVGACVLLLPKFKRWR